MATRMALGPRAQSFKCVGPAGTSATKNEDGYLTYMRPEGKSGERLCLSERPGWAIRAGPCEACSPCGCGSHRAQLSSSAGPVYKLVLVSDCIGLHMRDTCWCGHRAGLSTPLVCVAGGHGVGWSEIPRYAFDIPEGWVEAPVSIADLGGTEARAPGQTAVVSARRAPLTRLAAWCCGLAGSLPGMPYECAAWRAD